MARFCECGDTMCVYAYMILSLCTSNKCLTYTHAHCVNIQTFTFPYARGLYCGPLNARAQKNNNHDNPNQVFAYRHWIEVGVRECLRFGALHLDSLELVVVKTYGCFAFCCVLGVKSECTIIPN